MAPFLPFQKADSRVRFQDRQQAGQKLAEAVLHEVASDAVSSANYVVYALPRGGLPVAAPVARSLHCSLDVLVAKKITAPDNSELAIGAVTADGQVIWAMNRYPQGEFANLSSSFSDLQCEALRLAQDKAQAQLMQFAPTRPRLNPQDVIALIVDDGIATGMTMAAAVQSLRSQQVAQVWICVPIAPLDLTNFLQSICDRLIILATPTSFHSVSRFYHDFHQVSMEEALECLQQANYEQRES